MGQPILACGIEVPNGNFEFKSDGNGQSIWPPDGWSPSSQWLIDSLTTAKMRTAWTTIRKGDTAYPSATPHASRARAFSVALSDTATATTTRYLESPPSAAGTLWTAEAVDPFGTGGDFWWVRLRFWFRGFSVAPGSLAAWSVQVIGYNNAAETTPTTLCTVALNGTTDWPSNGWVQKASAAFKITASLHHLRVRIVCDRGAAGYSWGSFTDFSVETLGPVDAVAVSTSIAVANGTLAAEGIGGTYYQLSKDKRWEGWRVTPMRSGKGSRLPSGSRRWFDPSAGAIRRRFEIPVQYVTRKDWEKLYLLFLANKGQSQELASFYGLPQAILLSPQSPDFPGFYFVDFEDDEFPLEPDGSFESATELGYLYRGILRFVER